MGRKYQPFSKVVFEWRLHGQTVLPCGVKKNVVSWFESLTIQSLDSSTHSFLLVYQNGNGPYIYIECIGGANKCSPIPRLLYSHLTLVKIHVNVSTKLLKTCKLLFSQIKYPCLIRQGDAIYSMPPIFRLNTVNGIQYCKTIPSLEWSSWQHWSEIQRYYCK